MVAAHHCQLPPACMLSSAFLIAARAFRACLFSTFRAVQLCSLDELLGGGLRGGTVAELCGNAGSGKTQIVLNAAITTAVANPGAHVLLLTTSASVPVRRALDLALHVLTQSVEAASANGTGGVVDLVPLLPRLANLNPEMLAAAAADETGDALRTAIELEADAVLEQLVVVQAFDGHAMLTALQEVDRQMSALIAQPSGTPSPGTLLRLPLSKLPALIAIDCIAAVLSPILGGSSAATGAAPGSSGGEEGRFIGHALASLIGRQLRMLARVYHCAVLVSATRVIV